MLKLFVITKDPETNLLHEHRHEVRSSLISDAMKIVASYNGELVCKPIVEIANNEIRECN